MAVFTSRSEIESVFSQLAVDLRADDDDDDTVSTAEEAWVTDAIEDATDEMRTYMDRKYDPDLASTFRWVRRKASWIAAYFMSRRRGNPAQFVDEYERIIAYLKRVRDGGEYIPGLAARSNFLPKMSNQTVDRAFAVAKLRTERQTSVGGSDGAQHMEVWTCYDPYSGVDNRGEGSTAALATRTQGDDWSLLLQLSVSSVDSGATVNVSIYDDARNQVLAGPYSASPGDAGADWDTALIAATFTDIETAAIPAGPVFAGVEVTEGTTTCTYWVPFRVIAKPVP